MPEAAVELEDLHKRYGARTALDGLTCRIERGRLTALLGPNGAGKTTSIEICEGFRRPDRGTVRVLGRDPHREGGELRPRVGVMLQEGGLHPGLAARDMLGLAASFYAHAVPPAALLDRLGMTAVARTRCRRLSGGERQRLALAVAVVGRPELLFLDEPTTGLDPQARHATWELIEELKRAGTTIVLTTHYLEEAERLADHVLIVDHGRLVTEGAPEELTAGAPGPGLRLVATAGLPLDELLAALPVRMTASEGPAGHYELQGQVDPRVVAAVAAWCADRGVLPERLEVGRRGLEDVFLELTGREAAP
jgi:ABC-2 type transport system ATP-binding protein